MWNGVKSFVTNLVFESEEEQLNRLLKQLDSEKDRISRKLNLSHKTLSCVNFIKSTINHRRKLDCKNDLSYLTSFEAYVDSHLEFLNNCALVEAERVRIFETKLKKIDRSVENCQHENFVLEDIQAVVNATLELTQDDDVTDQLKHHELAAFGCLSRCNETQFTYKTFLEKSKFARSVIDFRMSLWRNYDNFKNAEQDWLALLDGFRPSSLTLHQCRDAVRKFVPPHLRTRIWLEVSGAKMVKEKNPGYYERISNIPKSPSDNAINCDLNRTFSKDEYESEEIIQEQERKLFRILHAYSLMDKDIGYCQGMNFVVAFLLRYFEEEDVFWLLAVVMRKSKAIWFQNLYGFGKAFETLDTLLLNHLPDLAEHFEDIGLSAAIFCPVWFQSLFLHPELDEYLSFRVWDLFLLFDLGTLLRIAFAILCYHRKELLGLDLMDTMKFLKTIPNTCPDSLTHIACVLPIKLGNLMGPASV